MESYLFEKNMKELKIGEIVVKLNTVVNPENLFDQLIQRGENHKDVIDENIPYWAELWPASIGISSYIVEEKLIFKGKAVLEIGCGLGLAGICAKYVGAKVLMTDYLEEALEIACENWKLNFDDAPNVIQFDWRKPDLKQQFDIVIGSDILYDQANFPFLLKLFSEIIQDDGILILSDPKRSHARNFLKELENLGFVVEIIQKDVILEERNHCIEIFVCRRLIEIC